MAGRVKELVSKYGRVAVVVHLSISAVSYSACYVAIKNNVDVNDILQRVGLLPDPIAHQHHQAADLPEGGGTVAEKIEMGTEKVLEKVDHAAVKVLNEGGAFAMAFLCNKALLPLRIPLTVLVTPPVSRFWNRRMFFKRP